MPGTRVLVVSDDTLAWAGLGALLAGEPSLILAGQSAGGAALAAAVAAYRPDVLLVDAGFGTAPIGGLSEISALGLPVAVLLSGPETAPEAWTSGAQAVLLRSATPAQIAASLEALRHGLSIAGPGLLPRSAVHARTPETPQVEELTPRELEVLRLLAEGLPNKSIGQRLGISEHTVKFHVNAVLGKLGVQSRTEAVVRAVQSGLIPL